MKAKQSLVILVMSLVLLGGSAVVYVGMSNSKVVSKSNFDELLLHEYAGDIQSVPMKSFLADEDESLAQQEKFDNFSDFFEENRKMSREVITASLLFLPIIGVSIVFFSAIWQLISVNKLLHDKRLKKR